MQTAVQKIHQPVLVLHKAKTGIMEEELVIYPQD